MSGDRRRFTPAFFAYLITFVVATIVGTVIGLVYGRGASTIS